MSTELFCPLQDLECCDMLLHPQMLIVPGSETPSPLGLCKLQNSATPIMRSSGH